MKPVAAGAGGEADAPTVLAVSAPTRGALSLWWSEGVFAIGPAAPKPNDAALLLLAAGYPASAAPAATARAAAGVQDEDGMLVWVELPADVHPDAQTALAMDALLERLGCSTRLAVPGDARALLGGSLDAAGNPFAAAREPGAAARLVRATAPGAHPLFETTPIVPISVWQPLQGKRVRYFYKPPPPASASAAPSAAPAPASSPGGSTIRVQ
jgi:hypothetical protein